MNDHDHKPPSPDFTIDLNVNVRFPGLAAVLAPAIAAILHPQLHSIERHIMTIQQDTQAIKDAATAAANENAELITKVDTLITVATETKDALVALQQAGNSIDPTELQSIIDTLNGVVTSANAEDVKVDAASATVAP